MIQIIKKKLAISLLFALSLSIASPVEAATIKETARRKLSEAYEKFEKQWKKIKPCITKRKCTKKQIAVFVGATIALMVLLNTIIIRKIPSPSLGAATAFSEDFSWTLATYYSGLGRYHTTPIASYKSLATLFTNMSRLNLEQMKQLVQGMLNVAINYNPEQVKEKYKNRFSERPDEATTDQEKYMLKALQIQPVYTKEAGMSDFFNYLALIPSANKDEVNELLQTYGVDPLPSK